MCTYARTIFECKHVFWGPRVKLCTIGEDFQQGLLSPDCSFRKPHGLKSMKLARRCDKCVRLDERLSVARKRLENSRAEFEMKWPELGGRVQAGDETGSDGLTEEARDEMLKEKPCRKEGDRINPEHEEIRPGLSQLPTEPNPTQERQSKGCDEAGEALFTRGGTGVGNACIPRTTIAGALKELKTSDSVSETRSNSSASDEEYIVTGKVDGVAAAGLTPGSSNGVEEDKASEPRFEENQKLNQEVKEKPRSMPKSRLASPASRLPNVEANDCSTRSRAVAGGKQPETPEKIKPTAPPKSRLALPVSRTASLCVKPAAAVSKLPRPGAGSKLPHPPSRSQG